jgi:hypothetical protein
MAGRGTWSRHTDLLPEGEFKGIHSLADYRKVKSCSHEILGRRLLHRNTGAVPIKPLVEAPDKMWGRFQG